MLIAMVLGEKEMYYLVVDLMFWAIFGFCWRSETIHEVMMVCFLLIYMID